MVKITIVNSAGKAQSVEAEPGASVMEAALKAGIDEIVGECGGACACATCHVYVAPEWAKKIPAMGPMESDMLDFAFDPKPTSRLSCQIKIGPELEGLVVTTPSRQG